MATPGLERGALTLSVGAALGTGGQRTPDALVHAAD
jgi:hypothetical protein